VFINCPFDPVYAKSFDAIVFATVCCGFTPRSAMESGSVGEPRLARITRAILGKVQYAAGTRNGYGPALYGDGRRS
jgi:hypothetical protein